MAHALVPFNFRGQIPDAEFINELVAPTPNGGEPIEVLELRLDESRWSLLWSDRRSGFAARWRHEDGTELLVSGEDVPYVNGQKAFDTVEIVAAGQRT